MPYELKKATDFFKSPGFDSSSKVLDTETGKMIRLIYYVQCSFKIDENFGVTMLKFLKTLHGNTLSV